MDNRLSRLRVIKLVGFLGLVLAGYGVGYVPYTKAQASSSSQTWTEIVQACPIPQAPVDVQSPPSALACRLGWQEVTSYQGICPGYYIEPNFNASKQQKNKLDDTKISADKVSLYKAGRSSLEGNVKVSQTARQASAQTAYLYRSADKGQVTKIELLGKVRLVEPNRLILAKQATLDIANDQGELLEAYYRIHLSRDSQADGASRILLGTSAWGHADKISRNQVGDYQLINASYTTCPPTVKPTWQVKAEQLDLYKSEGKGVARNTVFKVKNVPLFYLPYYSFPLDNRRKTGFLTPLVGYSNVNGLDFSIPFYWNMAPNYDMTLSAHYFSVRGVLLSTELRYLFANSSGFFDLNYLPNDKRFGQFINDNRSILEQRGSVPSADRSAVRIKNHTQFSDNWSLGIDYQRVSDDYYLQDFATNLSTVTENQLLQQVDLQYIDEHWFFMSKITQYQTLNPINRSLTSDIYALAPQLIFNASYDLPLGLEFDLYNEIDDFIWPGPNKPITPAGWRYTINPVISRPYFWSSGYVVPSISLQANYYNLDTNWPTLGREFDRFIPQYSIDSGLYFDSQVRLFEHNFRQTFEPRLYYLYVPFVDQTQIPVFSSGYYIFSYAQLFRNNRFSGKDRYGDANQLSFGFTSRLLDDWSGQQYAQLSVGAAYYFSNRRVQLCQQTNINQICIDNPNTTVAYVSPVAKFSPIASQVTYNVNPKVTLSGDWIWDPYLKQTNNGTLNLHYEPKPNHIIGLSYLYLLNGDIASLPGSTSTNTNLHQIALSYAWPFNAQWSSLGAVSYNISQDYAMTYLLGMQYESCCWAVRLMGGRVFQSLDLSNKPVYNNSVYLQILLKGLGTVASSSPRRTIASYITGYQDIFR